MCLMLCAASACGCVKSGYYDVFDKIFTALKDDKQGNLTKNKDKSAYSLIARRCRILSIKPLCKSGLPAADSS